MKNKIQNQRKRKHWDMRITGSRSLFFSHSMGSHSDAAIALLPSWKNTYVIPPQILRVIHCKEWPASAIHQGLHRPSKTLSSSRHQFKHLQNDLRKSVKLQGCAGSAGDVGRCMSSGCRGCGLLGRSGNSSSRCWFLRDKGVAAALHADHHLGSPQYQHSICQCSMEICMQRCIVLTFKPCSKGLESRHRLENGLMELGMVLQ